MQKFTTEWNGVQIVGEYDWGCEMFSDIYPRHQTDVREFIDLSKVERLCITRQLEEEVEEYLDYIRESYREDIAYDHALDQAVEIERNM
jgi:hypothetical protein